MREEFIKCMAWALGNNWRSIGFREIPTVWKKIDRSRPDLEAYGQKETMSGHYFYIYQITTYYFFALAKQKEKKNEPTQTQIPFSYGHALCNIMQYFNPRRWFKRCKNCG